MTSSVELITTARAVRDDPSSLRLCPSVNHTLATASTHRQDDGDRILAQELLARFICELSDRYCTIFVLDIYHALPGLFRYVHWYLLNVHYHVDMYNQGLRDPDRDPL